MSGKNRAKKAGKPSHVLPQRPGSETSAIERLTGNPALLKPMMAGIVALLALLLYANTLNHDYTLDDSTVIKGNRITVKGFRAIPELLRTSYWYGYNGVNNSNYRPLSPVMFAIEWALFKNTPAVNHAVNVLFYVLTALLLFYVLSMLYEGQGLLVPFITTLLYVAHPVHTEVVASIKSRDEIMCFFLILSSLYFLLRYLRAGQWFFLFPAFACYFLSLTSKETGITFVAAIPLLLYVFTKEKSKKIAGLTGIYAATVGLYLLVRFLILGNITGEGMVQSGFHGVINNPSVIDNTLFATPDFWSRMATAFFMLGKYILLLFFPHPLVWDYSYAQIPVRSFADPSALFAVGLIAGLAIFALIHLKRRSIPAMGILFFFITISLVSNILLLIKSTFAERFLYMPSLGFALAAGVLLARYTNAHPHVASLGSMLKKNTKLFLIVAAITAAYSFKTITRNTEWKNNHILYKSALATSPNSSRVHYNYATDLMLDIKETDDNTHNPKLEEAILHLKKSVDIFPYFPEAHLNLGMTYYYKKDYTNAIRHYRIAEQASPIADAKVYNNMGNVYGKLGQFDKSIAYLQKAVQTDPTFEEAYNNLGNAYAGKGMFKDAITMYHKLLQLNPEYTDAYNNLGSTYGNLKDYDNAIACFKKSLALSPDNKQVYYFLGLTYQYKGIKDSAEYYLAKGK